MRLNLFHACSRVPSSFQSSFPVNVHFKETRRWSDRKQNQTCRLLCWCELKTMTWVLMFLFLHGDCAFTDWQLSFVVGLHSKLPLLFFGLVCFTTDKKFHCSWCFYFYFIQSVILFFFTCMFVPAAIEWGKYLILIELFFAFKEANNSFPTFCKYKSEKFSLWLLSVRLKIICICMKPEMFFLVHAGKYVTEPLLCAHTKKITLPVCPHSSPLQAADKTLYDLS